MTMAPAALPMAQDPFPGDRPAPRGSGGHAILTHGACSLVRLEHQHRRQLPLHLRQEAPPMRVTPTPAPSEEGTHTGRWDGVGRDAQMHQERVPGWEAMGRRRICGPGAVLGDARVAVGSKGAAARTELER